jgi:hypothetical protein
MTDPVFGRISGVVPRHSEMPCLPADFTNIDYVLLSHAHRDHCDKSSLQQLAAHNNFELLYGVKNCLHRSPLGKGPTLAKKQAGINIYNLPPSQFEASLFCPPNIGAIATAGTPTKPSGAALCLKPMA